MRSDETRRPGQVVVLAEVLDGDAWDRLIRAHDHRVVLSLIAKGVTLDRARDIAQETWTRLIEQQRAGKLPRIELPGLAITQASFLALDDARRRRRGPRPLDDAPEADVQDPRANAEEQLVTREQIERAITELERCSPQAKRVFSLVYEGAGRPHADAARTLGISVQRVRQTLCEVRARLRGALEKNHG